MTAAPLNADDLSALCYGIIAAENGEADARMKRAIAFCNGNDDVAEFYDGPHGIARHVNARRRLDELARTAARVTGGAL